MKKRVAQHNVILSGMPLGFDLWLIKQTADILRVCLPQLASSYISSYVNNCFTGEK